jgi:hypothetical protein
MRSKGNAPKYGEPIVGFSFMKMLLHTCRFWLRISQQKQCEKFPILSWPGSSWFLLFPRLKSALKGRRFCDVTDINQNVTKELKRLSQNGFQECFPNLHNPWQNCIVAQGDYTEGNVGQIVVLFCISQKRSDSRNVLKLPRMTVRRSFNNVFGDAVKPGLSSPRLTTPALTTPRLWPTNRIDSKLFVCRNTIHLMW